MHEYTFDIRQFGAVGDGETRCTSAIQAAIDAAHVAGGGMVLAPPGIYSTGTLYLKSRVRLHLLAGATLLGSPERADYNPDDVFPENEFFPFEEVTGAHLIIAYQAEDVAITGEGTIDGNSAVFFAEPPSATPDYRQKHRSLPVKEWRPAQMVYFCRCRNVAVRDVALNNAPYWTLFLHGCESVQIRGLRITNPPETPNGDGIDVDCCEDVTISDCIIHSGDDSITLRGNPKALGAHALPCRNITVTNCVLSTPCNAIRVGVGDGEVRDCTLSNIVITESCVGINIVSWYSDFTPHGTTIENITFTGMSIDAVMPISMRLGFGAYSPAAIRDITFAHMRMRGEQGCYLSGNTKVRLSGIHFHDVDWQYNGGILTPELADAVPEQIWGEFMGIPHGLFIRHIDDLRMIDCRVRWSEVSEGWRHALVIEDAGDVTLRYLDVAPPPTASTREAVRLTDVRMAEMPETVS